MGRQSYQAIERIKKIASMSESEAKEYLRSEKRVEPEGGSAGSMERMVSVGTSEILKYLSLVAIEHEEWPACAIEVKQHMTPRCLDAIRDLGSKLTAYANDQAHRPRQ